MTTLLLIIGAIILLLVVSYYVSKSELIDSIIDTLEDLFDQNPHVGNDVHICVHESEQTHGLRHMKKIKDFYEPYKKYL